MQSMNVGVYPYSAEFEPIIRHVHLLSPTFRINALISPNGWGLEGNTIIPESGGEGWTVVSELETTMQSVDTLFIPEFNVAESVEALIVKQIEDIVPQLDRIMCAAKLIEQNKKRLMVACGQAKCEFEDLNRLRPPESYGLSLPKMRNPPLLKTEVPIVGVAGLWEDMDKFEVSLTLREGLIKNGYRVTQIGSRNYCELFGFHSFPNYMFDPGIDAANKILYLNQFIHDIAEKEKPDVVILTIPGAIQNLNERFTRGFGIIPHLVFQAAIVDFLLFCVMYEHRSHQFIQEISKMCMYRFGSEVDCYHMSNQYFDISESEERGKVIVNRADRETVSRTLNENFKVSTIPVINAFEHSSQDKLFDLVVGKLSGDDFQIVL